MKTESTMPYMKFSRINLAQQLALCGTIAAFAEDLGTYARQMSDDAVEGNPFPGARLIYQNLAEGIQEPYGLRVQLFEAIAQELDRRETFAPLAWHRIYLGCRALWAMTVAPLDKPHVLRENLELLANQSPEYLRQLVVAPHHLIPFPENTVEDWITASSGPEPAVRLLAEKVLPYGK